MVKQHKKTTANADVDMTPMLDIVFILLIFFIVTTSFVKERAIEVNRPLTKPSLENPKKQAQFIITENDSIYFANRLITPEQIIANLALFAAQFEMTNVQVTASEQSSHKTLVTLLDKIKQYQDVTISISTSL
ncbi:biopolymer transporter ExbD [Pseudoalteromonas sp. BZK2]|uniref:ExbD/TolR family protein n=1 Tax=Pseudoalteromonas sp. BZK2 TaxID=1904458 RepID=UPI001653F93A|nr:biopolymer transporter ExbD [Pseudoalteromonas sp. BZK2]MBC7009396.1 biopolymer transporter ExbD [Pseudoalteromonas sp. BZK2]